MFSLILNSIEEEEEVTLLWVNFGRLSELDKFLIKWYFGVDCLRDIDTLRAGTASFKVEEVMMFNLWFGTGNKPVQILILFHE